MTMNEPTVHLAFLPPVPLGTVRTFTCACEVWLSRSNISLPRRRGLMSCFRAIRVFGTAITKFRGAGLALLCALALSGCFKSDNPLISVFDSVAPIPEGTYSYKDSGGKEKSVVITRELTVTKMIDVDDKGAPKLSYLLMRDVGDGWYIVQDGRNAYGLIQLKNDVVIEYDEARYCRDLKEALEEEQRRLSDVGATSPNSGDNSGVCTFSSFDGLLAAFQVLENHGSRRIGREYHRR